MKKMNSILRRAVALMCVFVFAFSLVACGNGNASGNDTSLSDVKSKGKFILGLDPAFPPMGFTDTDQSLVGFDIDVAKAVCEKMGVTLELQAIDWETKEQELSTKAIDCIWNGFSYSQDRADKLTLSSPYMTNKQVAVVLADSSVNALTDLKGKTVVIQGGSTAEEAIDANASFKSSLKELVTVKDNVQALYDLGTKDSDAVVMDEVVARYYTEKRPGEYKIISESLSDEQYVIGFRKGDNALKDEVEKILKELAADGTLATISTKWFGKDITTIK